MNVARFAYRPPDDLDSSAGFPAWMWHAAAAVATALVVVALAHDGDGARLPLWAQLVCGAVAIVPWVPRRPGAGRPVNPLPGTLAPCTLAPVALVTFTGGSVFWYGLLALATARLAVFAPVWASSAFAAVSIAMIICGTRLADGEWFAGMQWFVWKSYVELALALGWAMRGQRLLLARSERSAHERARLAAVEERRRIAREVHDVIAHSLSLTLLQINGARMLVEDDPAAAAEVLEEAAEEGRHTLDEVRRVVGLLESPGRVDEPGDPGATAAAVDELVASYRRAGLDVELRLDLDMQNLILLAETPARFWGTAYRCIQEALANAVKHAPGERVDALVHLGDEGLRIEVTNPCAIDLRDVAPETRRGYGLEGMRERVEVLDGRVDCGPHDGVWTVRCWLPFRPASPGGGDRRHALQLGRAS